MAIADALGRAAWRVAVRNVVLASVTGALLGACGATPPKVDRYEVEIPAGITDARGRFSEVFCAVLAEHGQKTPDYRPCEKALTPVSVSPRGTGQPVELGSSHRALVAAIIPGVGWACFSEWLSARGTAAAHVRQYGYDQILLDVDALSGIEKNARQIRDAIMAFEESAAAPRLVLIGYSKGAPDILEAVVRYPEILPRIAAVVSVAGAIGGSPLADNAQQWQADLLKHFPGAKCDESDSQAVASLRRSARQAWLAQNALPDHLPFYSLIALPTPEHVSRILGSSYRKLGKVDWRNDSQLIYSDAIVPGSTLLGFLNADHWAVAVALNRTHPTLARNFVTQNAYPREALLEAILRFVEEDLDARGSLR